MAALDPQQPVANATLIVSLPVAVARAAKSLTVDELPVAPIAEDCNVKLLV